MLCSLTFTAKENRKSHLQLSNFVLAPTEVNGRSLSELTSDH